MNFGKQPRLAKCRVFPNTGREALLIIPALEHQSANENILVDIILNRDICLVVAESLLCRYSEVSNEGPQTTAHRLETKGPAEGPALHQGC